MAFRPVLAGALSLLAGSALLAALPTPTEAARPAAAAETYAIDADHSAILFRTGHLGVSDAWGRFNVFSGSFTYDADKPENMSVTVEVQADSIDTNVEKRDEHLRSADFFNAKQFPKLTFASKRIAKQSDGVYTLTGDLTLLGKTQSVETEFRVIGFMESELTGARRGASTEFTISRKDFGMTYGGDMLGDEVLVTVALEGIRQ